MFDALCPEKGAIYGGIMLASSMTIKTPPPGYKVPGLEAVSGPALGEAPAKQVTTCINKIILTFDV